MTHTTSEAGLDFIIKHECTVGNLHNNLKAYQDTVGVWTIGVGSTYNEDGSRIKPGQTMTYDEAYALFVHTLNKVYEPCVNETITSNINQNQFDALVSFTYNVGTKAFKNSTLAKMVNADPLDPAIRDQFMRWDKAGGCIIKGLMNRRKDEADLYFS